MRSGIRHTTSRLETNQCSSNMKIIPKLISTLLIGLLISACGGNSNDDTLNTDTGNKLTISGSVGDGPIVGAAISVKNSQGSIIATAISDEQAKYQLTVDVQEEEFPLLLEATNGVDLVTGTIPDFLLLSVVPNGRINHANLNPHSTLIVKTAKLMPEGLNEINLQQAKIAVTTKLNFGLNIELVDDPLTTPIDETNVVTITYSSEALAEMLRRTSQVIGNGSNEDKIIESLASDLMDGALDGIGADGTDPRHTAVSQIVGLQVLIEAMQHDLHVNGVTADDALTAAINSIIEASSKRYSKYSNTKINRLMLRQARSALAAIQEIDPSVTLVDLKKVLTNLGEEATTEEMIAALAEYSLDLSIASSLDNSISETVTSSDEEINAINDAANAYKDDDDDDDDDDENPTPTPEPGAPALTTALLTGTSVELAWTQNNAIPEGGYDILIDGVDTNSQYRTILLSSTIPGLDSTVSHCFAIQARYTDSNLFLVSNERCTDAVTPVNTAPTINGSPTLSVAEGSRYSFTPAASDPDGDSLSFSIVNLPDWASFSNNNGTITGTPGFNDAGVYPDITITVSDGSASAKLDSFSITVTNTEENPTPIPEPGAPALTSALLAGTSVELTWTQNNSIPEGGYDILIDGVDTNNTYRTKLLSNTIPGLDTTVSHCFAIQARYTDNNLFLVSNERCTDAVTPVNTAPTINGSPTPSVAEGSRYSFTPAANDSDGDSLRFSIANRPDWASFSSTTGTLSGSPGFDDANTYSNIVISVSDGSTSASLNAFSITVTETNQTPTISGSPATSVSEDSRYSFTPAANDSDGDSLRFSIANRPDWASFSSTTGTLSGSPSFDDANTYSNIVISVSDGSTSASLSAFSITVTETNRPPTISGIPASSITVGEMYAFLPVASDPDGDDLSFDVINLPGWANFNTRSGAITGSPDSSDAGLYEDIIVSVSDGSTETALNTISIMVDAAPATTGSATLSWTIPTSRTDGSPLSLSEIDGYRIYMGPNEDELVMIVDLNEGSATSHTLVDLASGTYVFTVTTYDTEGNESNFSNQATKTIM